MSNTILSGVPPLAVLFAAAIASRRLMRPSAPRLLPRLVIDVVVPSTTSLVVSTRMMPLAVAVTLAANSELLPKLPPPRSTVAVALTLSPWLTQTLASRVLIVALPAPSVVTVMKPR
jgi:hypothetical protein